MGSAGFGVVIAGLGCLQLYRALEATDLNLWVKTMVPAGLFAVLLLLIIWLVNKPNIADFMIASEGEMKKVNWSSRHEIMVSTIVVIVVVILMAVLLGTADFVLQLSITWLMQ